MSAKSKKQVKLFVWLVRQFAHVNQRQNLLSQNGWCFARRVGEYEYSDEETSLSFKALTELLAEKLGDGVLSFNLPWKNAPVVLVCTKRRRTVGVVHFLGEKENGKLSKD